MSDERVKGIPEDLRGIYDHASQFAGHMGDHQTVDGMICRLIERIASSEQALAALEARNRELESALEMLSTAVFGVGNDSEPDVYADYDKLCELAKAARAAMKGAS